MEFFMFWKQLTGTHPEASMRTELFIIFFFVFRRIIYIGTQGEVCTVEGIYTPVVNTTDRSKAVVPMLFLFCVAL